HYGFSFSSVHLHYAINQQKNTFSSDNIIGACNENCKAFLHSSAAKRGDLTRERKITAANFIRSCSNGFRSKAGIFIENP
ncbi:MAG: hypothetical protein LUE22_03655, partial [Oscillospiraceae bacterium]|nr:hypothetical protein [Oscillospiraceae bacterium]